ncbi:multicopper oxidase domain-containing protein [Streptomyces sp. NPDC048680]|uniref:multicopper oxidase domain-containing protein n=1 Tax=Streptomyces sp. NPDC048680 TaxID=3155492 RepID=UPI00343B2CF6
MQVRDARGKLRTPYAYDGGCTFAVVHGGVEIWNYLSLTGVPHPMHMHLGHFQVLAREHDDVTGFGRVAPGARAGR